MMRPILLLSLLVAIPAASEKMKPPRPNELLQLVDTVKNLEGVVEENQERLNIHKAEMDSLRKRVNELESQIITLKGAAAGQTRVIETNP
jgi:peptidoglycan hydrolase CwlO-like protein